jgi:diadenosine tetraphosphatase ApaH/serine/threonine PP2A family protein phosphatase
VHGNRPALEAVVDDARRAGADRFLLGGDYALFGAWPAETVAALRAIPHAIWIRGNVDRWTATPSEAPEDDLIRGAIEDCREALGASVVAELGKLPKAAAVGGTRYCHGSPISDVRSFMPEAADEDSELLGGIRERRLVFGHTHLQFRRPGPSGVELVNPGSVGLPFDGDRRAAYALMDDDGQLDQRRVEYDVGSAIAALAERFPGRGWAERSAVRLERARFA